MESHFLGKVGQKLGARRLVESVRLISQAPHPASPRKEAGRGEGGRGGASHATIPPQFTFRSLPSQ
jgi:hypothetical protein